MESIPQIWKNMDASPTLIYSTVGGRIVSKSPEYTIAPHIDPKITEDYVENGVKKRRRLTHLTPDERLMRR